MPGIGYGRARLTGSVRFNEPRPGPSGPPALEPSVGDGELTISDVSPNAYTLPCTSTPKPTSSVSGSSDTLRELGVLVEELGKKIGDTVTARILSRGEYTKTSQAVGHDDSNAPEPQCSNLDLSQLNVILKANVKDPPVFRGDGSDKCDIREWVDMMDRYLKRRHITVIDHAEEIMGRLMGKAKDVVRVSLRSNPSLDHVQHPVVIYSILKQHFSEMSYSSMPLADFYSTLPKHSECPIDYWLRLNAAADIAEECLQRQGRSMDNLGGEVSMMFIRNCPDPNLAFVFKSRPVERWTAKDVQEHLDEFQRESKSKVNAHVPVNRQAKQNSAVVSDNVICDFDSVQLQSFKQEAVESRQPHGSAPSDHSSLDRMADMLAKVIDVLTEKEESRLPRSGRGVSKRPTSNNADGCRICKDKSHNTFEHCRSNRLCFRCHGTGHIKQNCPVATPQRWPTQTPSPSSPATQEN